MEPRWLERLCKWNFRQFEEIFGILNFNLSMLQCFLLLEFSITRIFLVPDRFRLPSRFRRIVILLSYCLCKQTNNEFNYKSTTDDAAFSGSLDRCEYNIWCMQRPTRAQYRKDILATYIYITWRRLWNKETSRTLRARSQVARLCFSTRNRTVQRIILLILSK